MFSQINRYQPVTHGEDEISSVHFFNFTVKSVYSRQSSQATLNTRQLLRVLSFTCVSIDNPLPHGKDEISSLYFFQLHEVTSLLVDSDVQRYFEFFLCDS